jgi:hypothetical protein
MFKISSNFLGKVLKLTQLHETLLQYFMYLQLKFDVYEKIL